MLFVFKVQQGTHIRDMQLLLQSFPLPYMDVQMP